MKRNIKIVSVAAILAVLLAVSAYAAIMYISPNIPMTGNITAYEAQLFRLDTNTQVTAIPWGNLVKGANVNTETLFGFTQQLVIKNTGDYPQWVAWQLNGTLPQGVTLTCQFFGGIWRDLQQDKYSGGNGWGVSIAPGGFSAPIQFVLTVASDAPRGTFSFSINILAASTDTG